MKFKGLTAYFKKAIQYNSLYATHQLFPLGLIIFVSFPVFYWIWTEWFPQPYESLTWRLIGSLLGLGLMLGNYWPVRLKSLLPAYWFFCLLYALSFFFAYFFLMNNASVISAMSLLCSIFLLVLLVELPVLLLLVAIGWSAALLLHYFSSPISYFGEEHIEMLVMIIFVIIAGSTVNYKTSLLQQQRLDGILAAAGMIAHELRTPLLGIKSGTKAIEQYLPVLIQAYHLARQHNLLEPVAREARIAQIAGTKDRIIHEIDYANTIIDMLLVKAGREKSLENCALEECSIAECVIEALQRYPFKSAVERNQIYWEGNFTFKGSKLLMQHVLFNLLKNALYAIATAQKGDIHIWAVSGERYNCLYFKDTARGMTKEQLNRLFNHFYTTTYMGTGLGLSFCKLVMNRFGGDILCEAKEGEFTQFMLFFPISQEQS
ncbi:sensor protein LuxN [Legionella quinlivanii]|uniref:histidine kinase n=1 Tax=Legionella quinlivanii TaxID=45073 RepID=A0A0W0XST1_9GAMM|nr:HAMP domain-containing sensor histidine kinase [Legionella quinlivanii]KTD47456.1 sensor protein LuxN [Legionella quinlivanii]SEG39693.1 Signal transduction histidine kinase [Legionella quinlivanii DSM 21216]STY09944.1 sensor protein LuxN [Legionella quinlivanii]